MKRRTLWIIAALLVGGCSSDSSDPGSQGEECGGSSGTVCIGQLFCNRDGTNCGLDADGFCDIRPEICTEIFAPVCGCDGKNYASDCSAHAAGVSVETFGECEVESD